MAGILKVDDLRGNTSAGDITITSEGGAATQSLQQGLVKCWAKVNQTSTQSVLDSLNVTSITDDGTSKTTLTFTNSMNNVNYSISGSCDFGNFTYGQHQFASEATGTLQVINSPDYSKSFGDGVVGTSVHGDLA